jgi:hypothetical protein
MNIDGLVYLLNLAGATLAEAERANAALVEENWGLREKLAETGKDQAAPI